MHDLFIFALGVACGVFVMLPPLVGRYVLAEGAA